MKEKGAKALFLLTALFSMAALITITVFLLANGIPFIAETGVGEVIFVCLCSLLISMNDEDALYLFGYQTARQIIDHFLVIAVP